MELSIDRLTKQYQNKIAVDRISLRLNTGIYGLLGANGAGKTTLMRMVCGILKPTSGTITFDGIDVSEERYRSMLGYLPQDFGYYPEFTGEDFLLYMAELKRLKKSVNEKTALETEYEVYEKDLKKAKQLRKELSEALQQWLFEKFQMLNAEGESKDLLEIFKDEAVKIPPAGSGECCEPKLLQYAYLHGYKPLQMAMFWWGESPKEEIRHHLQFYPACNGKCKPILHWMLPKTVFETQQTEATIYNKVETLYEDRELAVIYKPEGLLSVPGKDASQPSVYTLMRRKYPEATGPLIVHRLDMATSGLMIIAKTEFAYHRLQKEFLNHRVQKKYVAIVCGKDKESCNRILKEAESGRGYISLPLMADFLDRPRQIVNREQGKEAITEYEVLERIDDTHLRLALYPKTGRTHQLRVHCAHQEGLNAPIIGDPLYGNETATRLHLHAEEITFEHPMTGKKMTITRKADF